MYGDNHIGWVLNPIPDRDNFVYLTLESKARCATKEREASTAQNLEIFFCPLSPKLLGSFV